MKSITYKQQICRFKVFRQSLRISKLWQFYRYPLDIQKQQNPTSQFKKWDLGLKLMVTSIGLSVGYQCGAEPLLTLPFKLDLILLSL
jgi:hypothetical protein